MCGMSCYFSFCEKQVHFVSNLSTILGEKKKKKSSHLERNVNLKWSIAYFRLLVLKLNLEPQGLLRSEEITILLFEFTLIVW